MNIVGITGPAGSGKDTAAAFLIKNHGFARIGMADKLKRICRNVFGFSEEQLWGPSSARNAPDERYLRSQGLHCDEYHAHEKGCWKPVYLTPRYALQQLGTEWGRSCYENVWVDNALKDAKQLLEGTDLGMGTYVYDPAIGVLTEVCSRTSTPSGVVFSDLRFRNEMAAVRKAGGMLIRLKRQTSLEEEQRQHASELEQEEVPDSYFDAVINNRAPVLDEVDGVEQVVEPGMTLEELEAETTRVLTAWDALQSGAYV